MKKILITGVNGYIGRNLVNRLNGAELEIIGLDKNESVNASLAGKLKYYLNCDLKRCNLNDVLTSSIDQIVHLAGISNSNVSAEEYIQNNIIASKNLVDCAIEKNINKLTFISTIKHNTNSAYGKSKKIIEDYIVQKYKTSNCNYTILRSAHVFGPGMKSNIVQWFKKIKYSNIRKLPLSNSALVMIGINDLCSCIEKSIYEVKTDNNLYTICDGNIYKINDIEKRVRENLGKSVYVKEYPRYLLWTGAVAGSLLNKVGINISFNYDIYNMLLKNNPVIETTFEDVSGVKFHENFYIYIPDLIADI